MCSMVCSFEKQLYLNLEPETAHMYRVFQINGTKFAVQLLMNYLF